MPDDVSIMPQTGDGTVSIATEEVTILNGELVEPARHVQRVAPTIITENGIGVDVTAATPMPVIQTGTPVLPTGASTSAKQDALLTSLATLLAGGLPAALVSGALPVTVVAGSATIGKIDQGAAGGSPWLVGGTVELGATTLAALETITALGPLTDTQLRASQVPVTLGSATVNVNLATLLSAVLGDSVQIGRSDGVAATIVSATSNDVVATSTPVLQVESLPYIYGGQVGTWQRLHAADADNMLSTGITAAALMLHDGGTHFNRARGDVNGMLVQGNASMVALKVAAAVDSPMFAQLSDGAAALVGQKVMAASLPVTLASDHSTINVNMSTLLSAVLGDSVQIAGSNGVSATVAANANNDVVATSTPLLQAQALNYIYGLAGTFQRQRAADADNIVSVGITAVGSMLYDGVSAYNRARGNANGMLVQGSASMVALKVDGSAVTQPTQAQGFAGVFLATVVTVGASAVALPSAALASRKSMVVQSDPQNTGTIYLGGSAVTADSASTGGAILNPGESSPFDAGSAVLYAIASAASQKVRVVEAS
jgi:hypothetical protein